MQELNKTVKSFDEVAKSSDEQANKKKARDSREYETMLLDLVRDEIKGL